MPPERSNIWSRRSDLSLDQGLGELRVDVIVWCPIWRSFLPSSRGDRARLFANPRCIQARAPPSVQAGCAMHFTWNGGAQMSGSALTTGHGKGIVGWISCIVGATLAGLIVVWLTGPDTPLPVATGTALTNMDALTDLDRLRDHRPADSWPDERTGLRPCRRPSRRHLDRGHPAQEGFAHGDRAEARTICVRTRSGGLPHRRVRDVTEGERIGLRTLEVTGTVAGSVSNRRRYPGISRSW